MRRDVEGQEPGTFQPGSNGGGPRGSKRVSEWAPLSLKGDDLAD